MNDTACARYEVHTFPAGIVREHKGAGTTRPRSAGGARQAGLSSAGGAWSACAHLQGAAYIYKDFGLNLAPFLLRLLAFTLQPHTALEIGCGLGTTADYIARFTPGGSLVTCVEPEPMLAEIFAVRSLPYRPTQLAVDLFSRGADECKRAISERRQAAPQPLIHATQTSAVVHSTFPSERRH